MLGAIIGDIVGSRFEWDNYKAKDFEFLTNDCFFTDDSVMSLALCEALLESKPDFSDLRKQAVAKMRDFGDAYPDAGYGRTFSCWLYFGDPWPYNSYGNGSAMRVSGVVYAANTMEQVKQLSLMVTDVTHNHPEGIKGAEATAVAAFMAKQGADMQAIKDYIDTNYYPMDFTLDGIRDSYMFNETCQNTVPQALMAFFESTSYEDAIRNAISIGGDSDTLAAITGAVAECYYGIPQKLREQSISYLDKRLLGVLRTFEEKYPPKIAEL